MRLTGKAAAAHLSAESETAARAAEASGDDMARRELFVRARAFARLASQAESRGNSFAYETDPELADNEQRERMKSATHQAAVDQAANLGSASAAELDAKRIGGSVYLKWLTERPLRDAQFAEDAALPTRRERSPSKLLSLGADNPASSVSTARLYQIQVSASFYRDELARLGITLSTADALRHVAAKWDDEPGWDEALDEDVRRVRVLREQEETRRMGFLVETAQALDHVRMLEAAARRLRDAFRASPSAIALDPYTAYEAALRDEEEGRLNYSENDGTTTLSAEQVARAASRLVARARARGVIISTSDAVRRVTSG